MLSRCFYANRYGVGAVAYFSLCAYQSLTDKMSQQFPTLSLFLNAALGTGGKKNQKTKMKIFTVLISPKEVEQILEKPRISKEERFRIQSFTPYTLVEALPDLQQSELQLIYEVEDRNILSIINIATGVFGEAKIAQKYWSTPEGKKALLEINNSYSAEEREYLQIFVPCSAFIKGGIKNPNAIFEGVVPKKLFSFRQNTAQEWLNKLTIHIFTIASKIAIKSGHEEALAYTYGVIAYYLNKSQPDKYNKENRNDDMNHTIYFIMNKFINETDKYLS